MDSRNLPATGNSTPGSGAFGAPARPGLLWSILGRIWALWVILIFVATMLLFYIPFLLFSYFRPDPQKTRRFYSLSRIWMDVFLPLAGTPLHVHGKEKFAKGQTYIVVSNHNALIDVPVTSPFIPGANKTIAKIEMARVPLFGLMYRTGSVLVDRRDENSRRDSFAKMKEALDMGLHMCIYPEGTRNKTAEPLKSFHDGAFRLAMNTGRPIIPAIIFNSRRIMPAGVTFYFRPYRLYLHFLDPVTAAPGDTVESLKEKIFTKMKDYYVRGPY
jgi:1-acyl-sn-glycerol-3-phosphate acyltransferase